MIEKHLPIHTYDNIYCEEKTINNHNNKLSLKIESLRSSTSKSEVKKDI